MDELFVDLTVLRGTERRLARVQQDVRACSRALRDATTAGLGSGSLDLAAQEFADSWSHGAAQVAAGAGAAREQLAEGLRVYAEVDSRLCAVLAS